MEQLWSIMANNGSKSKRIQKRVLGLVKKTGCWDPECNFTDAVEIMALFCIDKQKILKKWKKLKKKDLK